MKQSERIMRLMVGLIGVLLGVLSAQVAYAGAFSVAPVRIYIKSQERVIAVTLVNEGAVELLLQADVYLWSQTQDGKDILTLSEDLILSPPIIKLGAGQKQVVRLGILKSMEASKAAFYRLIVREIPEALKTLQEDGQPVKPTLQVPLSLAISMPVFINAQAERRNVECNYEMAPENKFRLQCTNKGKTYAQIRKAIIESGAGGEVLSSFDGGIYLLPGATKTWINPGTVGVYQGAGRLKVSFDDGETSVYEVRKSQP